MSPAIDVRMVAPRTLPDDPDAFLDQLERPTVFHVPGRDRTRCRAVAGSLHGNEPSGLRAIHRYLVAGETPVVDAWLFIGGVESARVPPRLSHRSLPGRRDLNRCFRPPFAGPDGAIAEQVLALLRPLRPELVVDLHNNTGLNPAYAIAAGLDARLDLAALFCDRVVWSQLSLGTFTEAFADLAPAITVECGRAGDPQADATAYAGLVRLMRLGELVPATVAREHMMILEDPFRVHLRPAHTLAFAERRDERVDVTLDLEIERHNFETVAEGTRLGWVAPGLAWPFEARDASGTDISRAWLAISGGELVARRAFVPFMLTTHAEIARSDCLFYVATRRT